MKKIQVLGSGCSKCAMTARRIDEVAAQLGVEIAIEKVDDTARIAAAGVMSTPAMIADGHLVHSGGIPSKDEIEGWLAR